MRRVSVMLVCAWEFTFAWKLVFTWFIDLHGSKKKKKLKAVVFLWNSLFLLQRGNV